MSHKQIIENLRNAKVEQYQPIHALPEITSDGRQNAFKTRIEHLIGFCKPLEDKRFLDLGCSMGWNLFELILNGATGGVGVDLDQNAINICKALAKEYKMSRKTKFYKSWVKEYVSSYNSETDGVFDYVLMLNVFHHMHRLNGEDAWQTLIDIINWGKWVIFSGYDGCGLTYKQLPIELSKRGLTDFEVVEIWCGDSNLYNMGRGMFAVRKTK
jgi:SAM-dependent methyltransferase